MSASKKQKSDTSPTSVVGAFTTATCPDGPDAALGRNGARPTDAPLLSSHADVGMHEEYAKDEKLLNEFLKLHPMLSLEAMSSRGLQLFSNLISKTKISTKCLPVVGKSHDDLFLAPALVSVGERECVNGSKCIANFLATMRYGPNSEYGFVCKEFLLPKQLEDFKNGKGLPARRNKCLLCTRYLLNFVYILARTDPSFKLDDLKIPIQNFQNECEPCANEPLADVSDLPMNTSQTNCKDGYRSSAMLFVDEEFANTASGREGPLSELLWKPVVRFASTDYKYVKTADGPRIVQVNIGFSQDF